MHLPQTQVIADELSKVEQQLAVATREHQLLLQQQQQQQAGTYTYSITTRTILLMNIRIDSRTQC